MFFIYLFFFYLLQNIFLIVQGFFFFFKYKRNYLQCGIKLYNTSVQSKFIFKSGPKYKLYNTSNHIIVSGLLNRNAC